MLDIALHLNDLILGSTLSVFSLLRASNYPYNKGGFCYTFLLYSHYRYGKISILFLFLLSQKYNYVGIFDAIVHWPTVILLFLSYCLLNCHGNFIFSKILNMFICGIFEHNFFQQTKKSITSNFWLSTISVQKQILLPKPSDHWNMEHYKRSSDSGEGDLLSDTNILASGNLQQYTTVPSHCDKFPWTWTWCLLYLIIDIIPRRVLAVFSLLRASNYHYNRGFFIVHNLKIFMVHEWLYCIIFLQSILLQLNINITLMPIYFSL